MQYLHNGTLLDDPVKAKRMAPLTMLLSEVNYTEVFILTTLEVPKPILDLLHPRRST